MMKINIGKVSVRTQKEAREAHDCIQKAITPWTGKLFRTQEFLNILPGEEDTEWTAPEGWVEIGELALYDDAYIIPFFEGLLEALDARQERGLVLSVSDELRAAYDAQWEKVKAVRYSLAPKVTGPMARHRKSGQ